MRKKVLILGGLGRQGSVIAEDLKWFYDITVADQRLASYASAKQTLVDLSLYNGLINVMTLHDYDLIIGALPSALGFNAMKAAVEVGINYVDLSFMEEDASLEFHGIALEKGIKVLHDCGIAPGISNMVAGQAKHNGAKNLEIHVGGVAEKEVENYLITWSPEDLYEEYKRPARIIKDGKQEEIPALTHYGSVYIDGVGLLESYYTDGLRSMLQTQAADNAIECTMRWPGHVELMKPFVEDGTFVEKLNYHYPPFSHINKDLLAMKIMTEGDFTSLVVRADSLSAMSRATSFSCAAFARAVLEDKISGCGVISPEYLIAPSTYMFILDHLAKHGIRFSERYPFMK